MRCAFLVAWREYVENARTKGFWIGIFLLPLILFLSGYVPVLLERKGRPTRHFVLVDQSGQFEKTVEAALEKRHQRHVLEALREYAKKDAQAQGRVDGKPTAQPARTNRVGLEELQAASKTAVRTINAKRPDHFNRLVRMRIPLRSLEAYSHRDGSLYPIS